MGCRIRHNREFGAEVPNWAYTGSENDGNYLSIASTTIIRKNSPPHEAERKSGGEEKNSLLCQVIVGRGKCKN